MSNFKKESIQEFLARGGKVTICKASKRGLGSRKQASAQTSEEKINLDALPANVKIALGLK